MRRISVTGRTRFSGLGPPLQIRTLPASAPMARCFSVESPRLRARTFETSDPRSGLVRFPGSSVSWWQSGQRRLLEPPMKLASTFDPETRKPSRDLSPPPHPQPASTGCSSPTSRSSTRRRALESCRSSPSRSTRTRHLVARTRWRVGSSTFTISRFPRPTSTRSRAPAPRWCERVAGSMR